MTVLFGIVVVILTCASSVLVAVLSHKAAQNALSTLDSLHKRQSEHNDKTLDRLMTIRWEDFLALQSSQEEETGGFIPPGEQVEEDEDEEKGRWGHLRRLRPGALDLSDDERELLGEDFPDASEG
jgi:hypothetical protein